MLLKKISLILPLALLFTSLSNQEPVDDANTLLIRIHNQLGEGDRESAINTFSELYHYYPNGRQVNHENYWIKMMTQYFEPGFVNSYLRQLLDHERLAILDSWMDKVAKPDWFIQNQNRYFGASRNARRETASIIDWFFKTNIQYFMSQWLDAGPLIKAFVNGSGFCSIFKHPSDKTSDLNLSNEKEVKIARIGSLIANLQEKNRDSLWPKGLYPALFNALRQISVVCKSFMKYPLLDDNTRKGFFISIINDISRPPFIELGQDICSELVFILTDVRNFQRMHFRNAKTTGLFLDECIDDIPRIFHLKLSQSRLNTYFGSILDRWMTRIEQYVQRKLGINRKNYKYLYNPLLLALDTSERLTPSPTVFPRPQRTFEYVRVASLLRRLLYPAENIQFDKYIRAIVEEVPTREATRTYAKGDGLCTIVSNIMLYFETLVKLMVEYGWDWNYSIDGGLVKTNQHVADFVRVAFLRIACQGLRNKFLLSSNQELARVKRVKHN